MPYVTEYQSFAAAAVWLVQVMPSVDLMTLVSAVPVLAIATKIPPP